NQGMPQREAPPARAPASPSVSGDVDLPATVARAQPLGLTASNGMDDAALPELVREASSIGAPARDVPAEPPSAAPARDASWIGGDEVSDAPVDSKDETARLRLSDLPLPIAA